MWPNPHFPAALVTFTEEILNGKLHFFFAVILRNFYLFKVINRCEIRQEICWNLTIKTPEQRQWRLSGVFIVKFEYIFDFFLVIFHFSLALNR